MSLAEKLLVTGGSGFIGTNLLESVLSDGMDVLNLDVQRPPDPKHRPYWRKADVLDKKCLSRSFGDYQPSHVIHMAARTDCVEDTTVAEGYQVNTVGTSNVLQAVAASPSVRRLMVVSTQYVCGPGYDPKHDEDFKPHTVYGQSKVELERLTRAAELQCTWTLVRPVNIWGPWHARYRREAWRVIERGLYLHPGRQPTIRTYGYVGNVVWQMLKILSAPRRLVHKRVFNLGDPPTDILNWVNGFSRELRGSEVRVVPRSAVRALGKLGDILGIFGLAFPITSSRYRSMTQHYPVDVEPIRRLAGDPPFTLEDGVRETVEWLRSTSLETSSTATSL